MQVVELMTLDSKRAVQLLILHRDFIPPSEVVGQLIGASKKCDEKYLLHLYLHSLFEIDPQAGKEFHDLQVVFFILFFVLKYSFVGQENCWFLFIEL